MFNEYDHEYDHEHELYESVRSVFYLLTKLRVGDYEDMSWDGIQEFVYSYTPLDN